MFAPVCQKHGEEEIFDYHCAECLREELGNAVYYLDFLMKMISKESEAGRINVDVYTAEILDDSIVPFIKNWIKELKGK